jgi:hypothetical protein
MDGYGYIVNSSDGKLVTALELDNAVSSDPVLLEDKVIVSTHNG